MARLIISNIACIVLLQLSIIRFVATDQLEEVCDVEGSGIDDCADQCCDPSICEIEYNPEKNPDKRCCTEEERKQNPIPSDCTLCTVCCDEEERKSIPLPEHCSKCPKCGQPAPPTTVAPPTTEAYDCSKKAPCKADGKSVVCGTDGITYDSICHLQNAKCDLQTIEIKHEGICVSLNGMAIGMIIVAALLAFSAIVGGLWFKFRNRHQELSQEE